MSALRFGFLTYGLDRPVFGISRSVLDLGTALTRRPESDPVFLAPYRRGPFVDDPRLRHIHLPGARRLPGLMSLGALELAWAAERCRLPLIHDPTGVSPFILGRRFGNFKRVVTLHDATPFRFPEMHTWATRFVVRRYVPATLPNVDAVITDSESSRSELCQFLSIPAEKVHVVPLGVEDRFQPAAPDEIERVARQYRLSRPFVLYVGALEPRKNLPTLLRAMARLRSELPDVTLVIAGRARWQSGEIAELMNELNLADHVRLTDYVAAADLPALYSAASVFCFPSFAEGFGLPVLEAMACGTPVVCSNVSSLPEVAGEAAIQVAPIDVEAVAAALQAVLTENHRAAELRRRGIARAAQFTWEQTATRTLAVYRQVLDG